MQWKLSLCAYLLLSPLFSFGSALKVINFNVWHGRTLIGIQTPSTEPDGQKEKRIAMQLRLFKEADVDVIILQEVDPVRGNLFRSKKSLAKKYAEALDMDYISVIGSCGLKIAGHGFPAIYSGQAILAKKYLNLQRVGGMKLSSMGFCSTALSIEFGESRSGLLGSINVDGKKVYVGSFHLHHGFNYKVMNAYLDELCDSGQVNEEACISIRTGALKGHNRRLKEVNQLVIKTKNYMTKKSSTFSSLKKSDSSEIEDDRGEKYLILGGDLNDIPDSEAYSIVIQGLNLEASVSPHRREFYTWDPARNKNSANLKVNFRFPYNIPKETPEEEKALLENLFKRIDAKRRKIDYVFHTQNIDSSNESLFGVTTEGGVSPSDHFGVYSELSFKD